MRDFVPINYGEEPQYHDMEITDWEYQQPQMQTLYSHFWQDRTEFNPDRFSENIKERNTPVDLTYAVLFIVNLFVTFVCGTVIVAKVEFQQAQVAVSATPILAPILTGIVIAISVTGVHFWYAAQFPYVYIKWGMFLSVIVSFIASIYLMVRGSVWEVLIGLGAFFGAVLVGYYTMWSRFPFTTAVFAKGVALVKKHPALIAVMALEMLVEVLIGVLYAYVLVCLSMVEMGVWAQIYFMFSYYWITYTVNYVGYMTGAGVAACDYFLNGTDEYPWMPVWESFKRAATRSFGSSAKAGLVLALISTLRYTIQMLRKARSERNENDNGGGQLVLAIVECIALCLLNIFESLALFLNRYGLIYCSIYGIPYTEGCRRWTELKFTRFIDVLFSSSVVDTSLTYNMLAFTFVSGVVGAWVAQLQNSATWNTVLVTLTAVVMSLVFFCLVEKPFMVSVDTYLVAFAEDPERLRQTDPELFTKFENAYHSALMERVSMFDSRAAYAA